MSALLVPLLAQAAGYSLVSWLVVAIVICAAIGIAIVALKHSGITIPPAIWTIIWIVLVSAVAIVSIRILLTL